MSLVSLCRKGDYGQVRQLIKSKASVDIKVDGVSPWMAAIEGDHAELIPLLRDASAEMDDDDTRIADAMFYYSLDHGAVACFEHLLERDCRRELSFEDIRRVAALGPKPSHKPLLTVLIEYYNNGGFSDEGLLLLHELPDLLSPDSDPEDRPVVDAIVAAGVDRIGQEAGFKNYTPLICAVNGCSKYIVSALIKACVDCGKDVAGFVNQIPWEDDSITEEPRPALYHAVDNNNASFTTLLLEAGADADIEDKDGWTCLFYVRSAKVARALIDGGANVNHVDYFGTTPLNNTCFTDVALLLLSRGADMETASDESNLLLQAIEMDSPDMVRLMLEDPAKWPSNKLAAAVKKSLSLKTLDMARLFIDLGADVNIAFKGFYPLHRAKDVASACLLLAAGADTSVVSECGDTPLLWHCRQGNVEVVQALLDAGADVHARTKDGDTALLLAARNGRIDVARALLAKSNSPSFVDAADSKGQRALSVFMSSPLHRPSDFALLLLENKADINAVDHDGSTALLEVCLLRDDAVCLTNAAFLIEHRVDVNIRNNHGSTALVYACQSLRRDCSALIVANKADVNAYDNSGRAPLSHACGSNARDSAEFLIASKADVDTADARSRTPLYYAYGNTPPRCAELLIQHQADVNGCPSAQRALAQPADWRATAAAFKAAPLRAAICSSSVASVKMLVKAGARSLHACVVVRDVRKWVSDSPDARLHVQVYVQLLLMAVENNDTELFELVFDIIESEGAQPGPSADPDIGISHVLLLAAQLGWPPETVTRLIEAEADAGAHTNKGDTPLMLAVKGGHVDVVEALLEHLQPEQMDMLNNNGQAALHIAMAGMWQPPVPHCADIIRLLVSAGAAVDVRNRDNSTPLLLLCSKSPSNQPEWVLVAELLLELKADVGAVNAKGCTALIAAARAQPCRASPKEWKNHRFLLEALVRASSATPECINLRDDTGCTALGLVMGGGSRVYCARLLLEAKADLRLVDNIDDIAKNDWLRRYPMAPMLLNLGLDVTAFADANQRALRRAVEEYTSSCISEALQAIPRPDVNRRYENGRTLLFIVAAKPRRLDALKALLAGGADPTIPDDKGNIPLLVAEHPGTVAALLDAAPHSINHVDGNGRNALMRAFYGWPSNPRHFLGHLCALNTDATDNDGDTVLHIAMSKVLIDVVEKLLELPIDVFKGGKDGFTVMMKPFVPDRFYWDDDHNIRICLRMVANYVLRLPPAQRRTRKEPEMELEVVEAEADCGGGDVDAQEVKRRRV